MPVERALALVATHVRPVLGAERVQLPESLGRVLAEDLRAGEDAPSSDRSRMDGYAVASSDLAGLSAGESRPLKVVGKALAGAPFPRALEAGACVEIATGAELPMRADCVVPVEQVRGADGGERVFFERSAERGAFVSRRASDYRAGEVLLRAGEILTPAKIAAAAAANFAEVQVRARPRVLIVPTGDEVQPQGAPLGEGEVRESNSHALAAFVASRGGVAERHAIVRDTLEEVARALDQAQSFDAAVFSGGSSAGAKDFLPSALARAGKVAFHGVALRPGKPIVYGQVGTTPVLGLPGNPTSCMVGAHLFLDRILYALQGAAPPPITATRIPLASEVAEHLKGTPADFLTLVLVRIEGGMAAPLLRDSMTVTGAAFADGYFAVPPGKPPPQPGDSVAVVLLR